MSGLINFEVMQRRRRAGELVPQIRECSERFKDAVAARDTDGMFKTSKAAWEAMTNLFDVLRNEQDHGNLAAPHMNKPAGFMADSVTVVEQEMMIAACRLDATHPGFVPLSLRNALNKIAHYDAATATYRISRGGAHYLILGGSQSGRLWVAEILVSKLCKRAASALAAIA